MNRLRTIILYTLYSMYIASMFWRIDIWKKCLQCLFHNIQLPKRFGSNFVGYGGICFGYNSKSGNEMIGRIHHPTKKFLDDKFLIIFICNWFQTQHTSYGCSLKPNRLNQNRFVLLLLGYIGFFISTMKGFCCFYYKRC